MDSPSVKELECDEFKVRSSDSQAETIPYKCHFSCHIPMRGRMVGGCPMVKIHTNLENFENNRCV